MRKKRILIIDDEVNFTQMVKINLEETGQFDVMVENDPTKCLEAIEKTLPDLILLDVVMPKMDGPDVIAEIKNHRVYKDIPVIFLTATIRKEEVEAHHGNIGGHSFLAKPSSIYELVETIRQKLNALY